jgi:tetratricopeptide (TPR) repeat protein
VSESRDLLQLATEAMQNSEFARATELLDTLLKSSPQDAKLWELRGVARTQCGDLTQAEDNMRRARELAPNDARILANLAVVRYRQNKRIDALLLAKAALEIDPNEPTARSVIEVDTNRKPGYSALVDSEPIWTRVGYAVVIFGILVTVLLVVNPPITPPGQAGTDRWQEMAPKADMVSVMVLFLWATSAIGTLTWLLLDMANQKARFTWIVPQAICCFCGMPWVPALVYILIGRKFPRS